MIIRNAARLVFAAGCLTAFATLSHAQPGYWPYGPPPSPYGYGSPPGAYTPQSQYVAPPPAAATAGKQLITNGPQTNSGDVSPSWSAQRNVVESQQYDRLLSGSPAFRQARMRKECGRLTIRNFIDSASTALLGTNSTAVG